MPEPNLGPEAAAYEYKTDLPRTQEENYMKQFTEAFHAVERRTLSGETEPR
jgi:hypothetical protein